MTEPKFEFYVLNHDFNKRKIFHYNIFNNIRVYDETLKEVKKYLRQGKNYKHDRYNKEPLFGFEGFCKELDSIIKWQEWCRAEYEIAVSGIHIKDTKELEKWDCYQQAAPNIEIIAREVIRAYKEWRKDASISE